MIGLYGWLPILGVAIVILIGLLFYSLALQRRAVNVQRTVVSEHERTMGKSVESVEASLSLQKQALEQLNEASRDGKKSIELIQELLSVQKDILQELKRLNNQQTK